MKQSEAKTPPSEVVAKSLGELRALTSEDSDEFHRTLLKEEAIAHFAAMNKTRECLLIAMGRNIKKGGTGKRYIDALNAIHEAQSDSQKLVEKLLME